MTGPQTSDALFKYVMATGIIKGDGCGQGQKKNQTIQPVCNKDSYCTCDAQMVEVMLHGHKHHEGLHYWGLKMLVDPVE